MAATYYYYYYYYYYLLSQKASFLSRTSLNIFSGLVYPKTKKQESSEFKPKAWANPFLGKNKCGDY